VHPIIVFLVVGRTAKISALSRFEYSEKSKLLTPNRMESPETFNDVIVDNVLRFLMHPHSTYLFKLNPSYCN
jgi:hypothetical protein